jgi:hypothetical protein
MKQEILYTYFRMRRAGVPLVVVSTADSASFAHELIKGIPEMVLSNEWNEDISLRERNVAIFGWDAVRGVTALNEIAGTRLGEVHENPAALGGKPDIALQKLQGIADNAIVLLNMKQEWLSDPVVKQGIANLRDPFSENYRMLMIIGNELQIPFELTGDVVFLDEQLPTRDELRDVITNIYTQAGGDVEIVGNDVIDNAVESMSGLTAFQTEQLVAIHATKTTLPVDKLWTAKKRIIGQTPGLSIFESDEDFSNLVGLENIKEFLRRLLHGKNKPNAIVFIDELEKSLNTQTNDSSGVSLDQLQSVLIEMTDSDAAGMLLYGVPGVGKSAIAKAAGNEGGIPTLKLDFGAAKGSLVGQSEGQIRTALKKIRAISSGRTLWIATCNAVAGLPAELRSRFSFGSFFFDIPGVTARSQLWKMYQAKFGVNGKPPTKTKNWTGREVRNCCRLAHDMDIPLKDAASYIVPVIESAAESVKLMRKEADQVFLDADHPGKYSIGRSATAASKQGRKISLDN